MHFLIKEEVNYIALTIYDWLYGTSTIATVFLAIVVGIIALSLFEAAFKKKELKAWRFLIVCLVFFALVEFFGALKVFGIYPTPHITHVLAGVVLAAMIASLVNQIYINRGCL